MIPDFQTIMLPFMQYIADGKEHSTTEIHNSLAQQFNLTTDEVNQYLPSGNQKIFYNRVFWAKAHLKMAGLLEDTKRAHFTITVRGQQVLSTKPKEINVKFLKQFPEYLENSGGRNRINEKLNPIEIGNDIELNKTPEELLDYSYSQLKKELAIELIEKIKECSPSFFERLVVDLLIKMGYGGSRKEAGRVIGKSGDGGIDGIINEDKLGLDTIYIQAKKWEGNVGRPEIQKFVGALAGQGAKKGIFITTSSFSKEAREYQPRNETKIVLIDGQDLANLMIENGVGVSTKINYEIKKMDTDYFEE